MSAARDAIRLPAPADPAPALPAGVDLSVTQLAPYVTPNFGFYRIDTALVVPQVDPATWRLRIHGRVGTERTYSYADLLARPMVERYVTLACVSNEVGGDLIGNARWLGVPCGSCWTRSSRRRTPTRWSAVRSTAGPAAPRRPRYATGGTRCWRSA
ncbi:hypothetical protein GCM10027614_58890 [Micromonospora vulcania]